MKARFLVMSVIDALGSGAFLPVLAVVLHVVMGVPLIEVGVVLTVATLSGLALGFTAAPLIRVLGAPNVIRLSLVVRAGCLLAYFYFSGLWAALIVTAISRVAAQVAKPALLMLANGLGEDRVWALAAARSWRSVAMAVGAAGSALLLAGGGNDRYFAIVAINALSYVLAAFAAPGGWRRSQTSVPDAVPASEPADVAPPSALSRELNSIATVLKDRAFVRMTAAVALLSIQGAMLTVALPLWLNVKSGADTSGASWALMANTVAVALLQVWVSKGATEFRGSAKLLRWSAVLLAAACLWPLLVTAGVPVWVSVAGFTALLTAGEMALSAGAWGASLALAPAARPEHHLTLFSWGESLGEAVSPLALAALTTGPDFGWLVLAAVFVAALPLIPQAAKIGPRLSKVG